jgi:hypothetical protein
LIPRVGLTDGDSDVLVADEMVVETLAVDVLAVDVLVVGVLVVDVLVTLFDVEEVLVATEEVEELEGLEVLDFVLVDDVLLLTLEVERETLELEELEVDEATLELEELEAREDRRYNSNLFPAPQYSY